MTEPKQKLSDYLFEWGVETERIFQAQTLESKLRLIKSVVEGYLEHGKGGGGRSICMRIKEILESPK